MKRGRPALTISALCEADDVPGVRRAFFEYTTTLGVRVHGVSRPELERRVVEIELAEGGPVVRVKVAYLDGRAVSAKPEHDDVGRGARASSTGRSERCTSPRPRSRTRSSRRRIVRNTTEVRDAVEERIRSYGDRAIVAHSGGVDSSLVLALAARALRAGSVMAVTALSPSYAEGELEAARRVAADVGVAHRIVRTREVEREAYARNDEMRCYHCKAELYATLNAIAASADGAVVLAGAIADDLEDFRPGLWAGERARGTQPAARGAGRQGRGAGARARTRTARC